MPLAFDVAWHEDTSEVGNLGNRVSLSGYKVSMDVVRRFSLLATASLLALVALLGSVRSKPVMSDAAAARLSRATAYFDSTIVLARHAAPRGPRGDALALGITYLERARIGLGSPFRLVDLAIHDPRLDASTRQRVGWALLGRLRRGDAYVVDPVVLDGIGPWSSDGRGTAGVAHVELIERAIRSASDPRAGELAVRLAYMIAASSGSIASSSVSVAAEVAALVRDRELAIADVRDLLSDAERNRSDVMELLARRRETRTLRVEQPALAPVAEAVRIEAMNAVPSLVRAIDTLNRIPDPRPVSTAGYALLGEDFGARAATLGMRRPAIGQVAIALRGQKTIPAWAMNDETMAAAYAMLDTQSDSSAHRVAALSVLSAAVSMRSLAQEAPWFEGDLGPSPTDVTAEFGLAGITFARSVPGSWRGYYVREMGNALRDMQLALPAVSFQGLRIRFSTDPLPDSALAMHDPSTRTLQLSVFTSSGTLAHELSHDLDWQTARRLYADGGGYSTDRAVRDRRGPLAASVRGLGEARVVRSLTGLPSSPPSERPVELFARSADWFVASMLALQGRSNGFLTAVEDPLLAGYAAGAPAAVGTVGVTSLLDALDQMTYVSDTARATFAAAWADPETLDPTILVRRVLETPVAWRFGGGGTRPNRATLPASPQPAVCSLGSSSEAKARRHLLALAVDARARGALMRRARFYPASMRYDWVNSVIGLAPWNHELGDALEASFRMSVVNDLSMALSAQGVVPLVPAIFRSSDASCSVIER